jgi:gliding-associated putative ABC transporter substrate-binding component GldG
VNESALTMNFSSKKSQAIIRALLILAILIVVNIISIRIFTRFDLTAQNLYTLTDASKKLVGSLDDRVNIKAYFTEDLPAPYNNTRRDVLDMLNDYKAYSHGNLTYEFISPEDSKGEEEAQQQGIPPVQVQVVNHDKLEVKRAYLGLVMMYEDRKEVLPVIQNVSSLEYDISSALHRLTMREKKKVGYTTGHGEADLTSMKEAYQELSKQYSVVPVDLSHPVSIDQTISALLVIAPTKTFNDSAKYQIDQYIMHGGKVAFLLNAINASLQQQVAQPLSLGLDDLLAQYGVRVNQDLVRDAQCANVNLTQQQMGFTIQSQIPFPYMVAASNFSPSNMIVKDLHNVIFPFVSSVDTTAIASKGLKAEVLARSSKHSGRQTGFFPIDPMHRYTLEELSESNIPLAVVVDGSFKSFFTGKNFTADQTESALDKSPNTRIIVVGDGDFMNDNVARNPDNLALFANTVDYLTDDAGLITIRSKNVELPSLEEVSDGTKKTVKYGNLLLPPVIVIAYGLFRWRSRRARKRTAI